MSIHIPVDDAAPDVARRGDEPRVRRRTRHLSVLAVPFHDALTAVPMPREHAARDADAACEQLTAELEALQARRATLEARQARRDQGARTHEELAARWLAPVDPLDVRNALLEAAHALGLRVRFVDVEQPEASNQPASGDVTVLGSDAEDTQETPTPIDAMPQVASSFTLVGTGRPSRVLLLAALVAELPQPVRLTRLALQREDAEARFELEARRLVLPALFPPGTPRP